MKIFIAGSVGADWSQYLAAVLHAHGLISVEMLPPSADLSQVNTTDDLLIIPAGAIVADLTAFLQSGGRAIAFKPSNDVIALGGLSAECEREDASRLRFATALCPGARGEPLWTPVPRSFWQNKNGNSENEEEWQGKALAYLFVPGESEESIGIARFAVGAGSLTVFAYDPIECIVRLRQGVPERADWTPQPSATPRAIYLHESGAPQDASWRPTADLHAAALYQVIKNLLSERAPTPTLWHLPAGQAALLLFSGDEDGGTQEANHEQMAALEKFGGAMNLYVIHDATSITREKIEEYSRRGHVISVHPNLVPSAEESPQQQLEKAAADVLAFREKFDQPVRTLRDHCYMWPGYVDLPEVWERLGVGMDFNTTSTCYGQSQDWGPYINLNAAMPLPFARQDGSLVDVYQQPTHFNDDLLCHPTKSHSQKYLIDEFDVVALRILEDAANYFHAPICANFHPCNFVLFSGEHGRLLMQRAHELNIPIWSSDRWHDFWRARNTWRMSENSWHGRQLRFTLSGEPCEELCITLPPSQDGHGLRNLFFNDEPVTFQTASRFGQMAAWALLPPQAPQVEVRAEYV